MKGLGPKREQLTSTDHSVLPQPPGGGPMIPPPQPPSVQMRKPTCSKNSLTAAQLRGGVSHRDEGSSSRFFKYLKGFLRRKIQVCFRQQCMFCGTGRVICSSSVKEGCSFPHSRPLCETGNTAHLELTNTLMPPPKPSSPCSSDFPLVSVFLAHARAEL